MAEAGSRPRSSAPPYAARVTRGQDRTRHADAGRTDPAGPSRGRREPVLGGLDRLEFGSDPVRAHRHASRPVRWPWWLALALLALVLLGVFRQPLADRIWPQTRAQALRAQADKALAQGRLTAADGSGARELYEAALAMDPDRDEAREGLMRVAAAALAQAHAATMQNRFADAHAALRLARALEVPRADATRVEAELRSREAAHAGIPQLLARAESARKAGRLAGADDAALPLYQRVLALQPEDKTALEGREDALSDLLQAARAQLSTGDLAAAVAAIATARGFDPGHVDLPQTEARLNEELEDVRKRAVADLRRGRLDSAEQDYRLLGLAGQQAESDAGIEHVAAAYAHRAETLAGDFRFADADAALAQARRLAPRLASLVPSQRHIEQARQAHARMGSRMPPRERARRVARLLEQAAAAEARGDLLEPPGDSAFDKLRAARALAPDDVAVKRASAHLLPTAKRCFEQELQGNNLARARACLDARVILDPDDAALALARRRLARRWLAVGDERMGAGELRAARAALESARGLDPAVPGLAEFQQRVRAAEASSR